MIKKKRRRRKITNVFEYINELNISKNYKKALIKCAEELFDPTSQLNLRYKKYKNNENLKMILIRAEGQLVMDTRVFTNEYDVIFGCPNIIEDDIIEYYKKFLQEL